MAFAPNGRALYGLSGSGLWVYRVDPASGMLDNLRRVATVTQTSAYVPRQSLTIEPSGRFLYVPSSFSDFPPSPAQIEAFAIDPGTGDLSKVPGSPFFQEPESARTLTQVVADPTGRFLYASRGAAFGEDLSDIWAFAIDRGTGALAEVPGSPFLRGRGVRSAGPAGLAFDPGGKTLYVAACDKVHVVEVDDGGRLNPLDWVPLAFCSHELGVVP
jgi:6-phosphogluconolactonase (cycloisomerase 2 family)